MENQSTSPQGPSSRSADTKTKIKIDKDIQREKDKEKKATLTDIKVAADHPVCEVADAEQDSREATHWIPAV